jgi:pimeloyl-ACP methyl ester carboxylesterase
MPVLETNGAALYYERHGEGPAIVFVHGMGGNHATWYQQIPVFAQSYEVISFDQRGFGRSTNPGLQGRDAFADDLAALVEHLGLARVALVGQSMGGGTCVGFAARNPRRVAALVLADTIQGLAEPAEVAAIMSGARAQTAMLSQPERVLSATARANHPAQVALYAQLASFNATDRHNLRGEFAPLLAPAALGQLGFPTLFIVGQQDVLFPPAAVRGVQREVPGSFFVEVSDSGHSAYFEQPQAFNDAILTFLQAVGFRGRAPPAHSNAPGYARVGRDD